MTLTPLPVSLRTGASFRRGQGQRARSISDGNTRDHLRGCQIQEGDLIQVADTDKRAPFRSDDCPIRLTAQSDLRLQSLCFGIRQADRAGKCIDHHQRASIGGKRQSLRLRTPGRDMRGNFSRGRIQNGNRILILFGDI